MNDINEPPNLNVNDEGKDLDTLTKEEFISSTKGNSFKDQYIEPENGPYSCFVLGYN